MIKKTKFGPKFGVADVIIYFLLGLFALITLYPFIYVLAGSFSDGNDFALGGIWILPRIWSVVNYQIVLSDDRLWFSLMNTVIITVTVTTLALLLTSLVAYALSKPELKCRKFFQYFNLFTMFFSGGLIPYFIVMVLLGLYNNYLIYIIPRVYSVYNMIVISSFFKGLPNELRESMLIDGACETRIWFSLYIPLSTPVLATVGLWVATGTWNNYFTTMMYTMGQKELMTLQYFMMKLIKEANVVNGDIPIEEVNSQTVSFAAMVLSSLPIIAVFPFVQKYFAKGITIGAVKG